jgi:hypothetical protein
MCDLERRSSSPAEVLSLLGSEPDAHVFRAEVARLEALPDISEYVAAESLRKLLREFDHLFGHPVRAKVPPVHVRLKEECMSRPPISPRGLQAEADTRGDASCFGCN